MGHGRWWTRFGADRCRGRRDVGRHVADELDGIWREPLGTLTQLPGTAGCFTHDGASEDGAGTCSEARGLAEGESAAVSPDGANVYVGSYENPGASLTSGYA